MYVFVYVYIYIYILYTYIYNIYYIFTILLVATLFDQKSAQIKRRSRRTRVLKLLLEL